MVDIASYNKVLNYLETSKVDVQWLNSFDETSDDKGSNYVTDTNYDSCIIKDNGLQHDTSYNINSTTNVIFNFNSDVCEVKLDRFNYLEFTVGCKQELNLDEVSAVFSRLPYCEVEYLSFNVDKDTTRQQKSSKYDNLYTLSFLISDSNYLEHDHKYLTDIRSLKLYFGTNVDVTVYDVCVRQTDFTLRVKDIDEQIVQARKYILRKIREDTVPYKLQSCITRVTVAHLWLNKWYEEGQKASSLGEFSTQSYYDKLMESVDGDIDAYNKDKGTSEDKRYLDSRWLGSR